MKNLFTKIWAELGGLTRDGRMWGVGTVSVLKAQGEGAVTGTQSAITIAGSCLTELWLWGEAHCQTMAPAQQGESWGHKHSNLSFLPSVIFYWDFPLVDPDWKPADKGAECHSLLSSASQGTEQSG